VNLSHIRPTVLCNIELHNKRYRYLRNSFWCWCSEYQPVNLMLLNNVFSTYRYFTSTKYGTRTIKYFIILPLNIDSRILRDYVHLNFQIRNTLRTIVMDEEWPKHVLSDKSHKSYSLLKNVAKSIIMICHWIFVRTALNVSWQRISVL
jgi:hypothetical protein